MCIVFALQSMRPKFHIIWKYFNKLEELIELSIQFSNFMNGAIGLEKLYPQIHCETVIDASDHYMLTLKTTL